MLACVLLSSTAAILRLHSKKSIEKERGKKEATRSRGFLPSPNAIRNTCAGLSLQCRGIFFLLAPLKPGYFWRLRHALDSPNLGGHLPHPCCITFP
ncbi:hypothetical protein AVEN_247425-1 [Araneus ventricosus]|uniref:Uncharacterized protein n=1 Tax=Araneus ventricosus TaxID=182803 RepID=A0A4Y2R1Q9_ARAVE|nr:hypothetical protein AVEN_66014-1 [Araneus ventricosus]GBN69521.1 hypothetical protein AVEN_247425-1 [Araneus ventricosus]